MKLAALTQRVVVDPVHGERRDALDQRWHALLGDIGYLPVGLPNTRPADADRLLARLAPDLVILTGGNSVAALAKTDAAPERDAFESALIDAAMARTIPIAGICRGMQAINRHFGGTLRRLEGHAASRHSLTGSGAPPEVNSYHDWGIAQADLAPDLIATAYDAEGNVEALCHAAAPITGIMWHPEREHPFRAADLTLLRIA